MYPDTLECAKQPYMKLRLRAHLRQPLGLAVVGGGATDFAAPEVYIPLDLLVTGETSGESLASAKPDS